MEETVFNTVLYNVRDTEMEGKCLTVFYLMTVPNIDKLLHWENSTVPAPTRTPRQKGRDGHNPMHQSNKKAGTRLQLLHNALWIHMVRLQGQKSYVLQLGKTGPCPL